MRAFAPIFRARSGWHLGQPKYLLALKAAREQFPDAKWYLLADSDTLVFPHRLLATLRLMTFDYTHPLGVGAIFKVKDAALPQFSMFLGGAGILASAGALSAMDLDMCIASQRNDLAWSSVPADWRVGLCMQLGGVQKIQADYMYQSNAQLVSQSRGRHTSRPLSFSRGDAGGRGGPGPGRLLAGNTDCLADNALYSHGIPR